MFAVVTSSRAGGRKSVLKSSESFDTMERNCSEVPGTILFGRVKKLCGKPERVIKLFVFGKKNRRTILIRKSAVIKTKTSQRSQQQPLPHEWCHINL